MSNSPLHPITICASIVAGVVAILLISFAFQSSLDEQRYKVKQLQTLLEESDKEKIDLKEQYETCLTLYAPTQKPSGGD